MKQIVPLVILILYQSRNHCLSGNSLLHDFLLGPEFLAINFVWCFNFCIVCFCYFLYVSRNPFLNENVD